MKLSLYIACVLFAGAVFYGIYHVGYQSADTHWQLEWTKRDKADLAEKGKREKEERTEEQRRQNAANEERGRAAQELAAVKADAANAGAAGERLQRDITNLRHQLAGSETGRISAVAGASAAKAQASSVLALVLSESVEQNIQVARFADAAYIAGSACERTYGEVTKTNLPR